MQTFLVILSALSPVVVLLWYIFRKDKEQPEPTKWLLKAFFYGVASALVAMAFSILISLLLGIEVSVEQHTSVAEAFLDAFCLAAIPEEVAKLFLLCLLLRKNPFFDEHFDGIVYAVCVGMGFAGFENILYLLGGLEDGSWVSVGIMRALFSVPGHFFFAVLMGYYYSLYYFRIDRSFKCRALILLFPILAHGIFDGILFSIAINSAISFLCMILFLFFFNKLRKMGKERINKLIHSNNNNLDAHQDV